MDLIIENIPQIVDFMSFRKRSKREGDCPYYLRKAGCHPEIKDLNCFLCACPQYLSEKQEGGCRVESKRGKFYEHPCLPEGRVWDCSECRAYHHPKSVESYLTKNIESLKEYSERGVKNNL